MIHYPLLYFCIFCNFVDWRLQHIFKQARLKKQLWEVTQHICDKPESAVNKGMIAVHRYNTTLFTECMTVSVNDYIQAQFANGYNMRMTQLDWIWPEDFNWIKSMITLPKINNVMTSMTKNETGQIIHQDKC